MNCGKWKTKGKVLLSSTSTNSPLLGSNPGSLIVKQDKRSHLGTHAKVGWRESGHATQSVSNSGKSLEGCWHLVRRNQGS